MCGIAGLINARLSPDALRDAAAAMAEAERHRGPDSGDLWQHGRVALSHRRLEVIDLSTGSQPMHSDCGRYVIVFNGEIYNFKNIRKDLKARGYRFRTSSDTEVLLTAYMEFGEACLDRFEGMFAFAIWDTRDEVLFAARDRMGKKPFYYSHQGQAFAFASELSALKNVPGMQFSLSLSAVAQFLSCKYVPTPGTIFSEANKLPPGHSLTLKNGTLTIKRYWHLPAPTRNVSAAEASENIRELLHDAVSKRLISDVPLGAFLSGGLDSTVIVSLMAQLGSDPVQTFSIGFEEKSYDESHYAEMAAQFAGSQHRNAMLSGNTCADLVSEVVGKFDEPLADPSIIPTYFLCRFVKEHVTVALSGDGADELFGGYENFPAFSWAQRLAALGPGARWSVRSLAKILPVSTEYMSPGHMVRRFSEAVDAPPEHRVQRLIMGFSPEAQEQLWTDMPIHDADQIFGEPGRTWNECQHCKPLDAVFQYHARHYLLDYILNKVDRCSMMHGLEVRAPFLDTALVEYVFSLPAHLKIPGGKRKHLMKQALKEYMPPEIQKRNKRGFLMPVAGWLGSALKPQLARFADPAFLTQQGLFRPEAVAQLIQEHESNTVDRREELWTFLVLQLWLEAAGL